MFPQEQMSERVVVSILMAFLLFAFYSWVTTHSYDTETFINKQHYEISNPKKAPVEASVNRIVSPGGAGTPNQRPPKESLPTVSMDEKPFDPQDDSYESAEIPERLRHPERSFGPGMNNTQHEVAVDSGIASSAHEATTHAYQVFGPEFAQNGGAFMDGIFANDTTLNQDYSSV